MKLTFLGTNGWYDTDTGNTICTLIESDDYFIILDAGNGIYKLDRYIPETSSKPVYLFLSHFHFDHIAGLHILTKFRFSQGLTIYGQEGTRDILDRIINEPYTVPFAKLPFKVTVNELSEGYHHLPFPVESRFLLHSSTCMGYRFELDNKVIAYCPDTGICDNAKILARNSDLLIAECALKSGERNNDWPHLNPEDAAQIAKEANAGKLALVHFDANRYNSMSLRKDAGEKAREIFGNTVAAVDGMQVEL